LDFDLPGEMLGRIFLRKKLPQKAGKTKKAYLCPAKKLAPSGLEAGFRTLVSQRKKESKFFKSPLRFCSGRNDTFRPTAQKAVDVSPPGEARTKPQGLFFARKWTKSQCQT
jgi:hypothetical protein